MDQPLPVDPGWDDQRLDAAFAARASRVVVPVDLTAVTVERLRPATAAPWWRRLLPAGAVAALLVAVVGGGIALVGGPSGLLGGGGGITFRDGPSADLRTLDAGTFALDFPADWHGYDATGPYQGTSLAVLELGSPSRVAPTTHLDITCVYERPLEPGEARIVVGLLPYRSGSILDRLDIEDGATTRLSMGGMPAILDERDETPDDFYLADDTATWSIGTPDSLTRVVQLDFQGSRTRRRGRARRRGCHRGQLPVHPASDATPR